MSAEIATAEPVSQQNQMMALIEKVVLDPNADADKMGKLLDMQERIFDKNAVIAFNKAMVACQADMPTVAAKAYNGQTKSLYAKYEHLLLDIKPVYTKHGFSLSFGQDLCSQKDHITVACDVIHADGHSKQYHSTLPIDDCGIKGSVNKTGVHATASAYSYAKRYLATMIFNIAIADHDDDAVKAGGITIEQLLDYNFELRKHIQSIAAIKQGIYDKDYYLAGQAWFELDQQEQKALWKAPSKGGIFTTEEIKVMKEDLRSAYYDKAE